MRILITGGAGFIGSNFIRYWLRKHSRDEIINLDKLTYAGHLSSTKDFSNNPNYYFVKADICNAGVLSEVIKKVDTVVHFAAESHVDRSILKPASFIRTNIVGTQMLLDAALRHKIKRFHHISTDEVFGSLSFESKNKFKENNPYDPRSPYAASKAASDHLVRAYFQTFNLPFTITNCSNNYGPFQDPEKFIPRIITNLIDDQEIPIYGDGKYVRDWLYVDDHCRAIELVLLHGRIGETYCVGGQSIETNNLAVAEKLLKLFGKDEKFIKFVADRPGHDRRYAVDWSKIKKDLGWSPTVDFDAHLKKTVHWYRRNEWWWRPLKARAESIYKKKYNGKI